MAVEFKDIRPPVAPYLLALFPNKREVARRLTEYEVPEPQEQALEAKELCLMLDALEPESHWKRNSDFFKIYLETKGNPKTVLEFLNKEGATNNHGKLDVRNWQPPSRELMDIKASSYPEKCLIKLGINPERFYHLANRVAAFSWIGYYVVRAGIENPKTHTSLLVEGFLEEIDRYGGDKICIIGLGEDEAVELIKKGKTVFGINKGYSPIMEKMIAKGLVNKLASNQNVGETIDPQRLQPGRVSLLEDDVTQGGIILPDSWGTVGINFGMHHIPIDEQADVLQEMARVAKPMDGGRALVVAEDSDSYPLFRLKVGLNAPRFPVTALDAVLSHIEGCRTVDNLLAIGPQLGISLHSRQIPAIPESNIFRHLVIPATQTIITGYNPRLG